MTQEDYEQAWDRGWEEHKLHQKQRMAAWPLSKKLEWLEQAHFVVISLHKSSAELGSVPHEENKPPPG